MKWPDRRQRSVNRGNMVRLLRDAIAEIDTFAAQQSIEHCIAPAGIAIDVRFDDPTLAANYSGRLHRQPCGAPVSNSRICVFTGKRAQLRLEWGDSSFRPADFHAELAAAGLRAAYPFRKGLWQLFDTQARVGLQWSSTTDVLPAWDASTPLRQHLHWILQHAQMRLVHAATLGHEDRGILILGRGGAGKSGTTLAGLAVGLSTVGDDYVALANDPAPLARALLRLVKQDRQGLSRIPGLAERTADLSLNWRGKVELDPSAYFAGGVLDAMPVRAAVVPRIAHVKKPRLTPIRAQSAMLSLMTSNLHQFAGEEERGLHFFARFLKDMPCYQLDLSPDAIRNGNLLREFIERLPA